VLPLRANVVVAGIRFGGYETVVLEAAFWGFVAGGSLLIGALLGMFVRVPVRVVGFGVGILISAVAFELTGAAYDRAGAWPVVLGLSAGAWTFFLGDLATDRQGAEGRKDPTGTGAGAGSSAATSLVLGAMLDGIPESAAVGVSLIGGGSVGVAVVIAVFLSHIPESLSASVGMKRDGRSNGYILRLWTMVVVASTVAAALGCGLLGGAGDGPGFHRDVCGRCGVDDAGRHHGSRGRQSRRTSGWSGLREWLHRLVPALHGRRRVRFIV
jgi:zinc transporter, ZIP family